MDTNHHYDHFQRGAFRGQLINCLLDFPDQSKCEAAATAIGTPGWIRITPGHGGSQTSVGGYLIITRCVQR